jgi:hypothetical protein
MPGSTSPQAAWWTARCVMQPVDHSSVAMSSVAATDFQCLSRLTRIRLQREAQQRNSG